jgi:hypothetical protein
MKNKMPVLIAVAGIALASIVCFLTGCESESADTQVTVTPGGATIAGGQSIEFTASGGYDYTWSLSDPSLGTLNTRTGPTVVYTASSSSSSSGTVQTLTVISSIAGASTVADTSTNTTTGAGYNGSATATTYVQISQY